MFRRPSIPWTVAVIVLTAAASAPAADKAPAPSSPVVTPAWLAEHLDAPDIVLVDTRAPLREYLAGHIPGAQPLSVENLRSVSRGVPGTLYSWDTLRLVVQRLGIRKETHVVVYGAENDTDQTYVASVLAAAGVGRVSVLDGGMKAWTAAQRPVVPDRRPVRASSAKLRHDDRAIASLAEVRTAIKSKIPVLVDARSPEQYQAGRIPGALSRFWKDDLVAGERPDAGLYRGSDELAAEYAALGITKDRPVIVYCNTGQMASSVYYTLRFRLGYREVKLYNGSWLEWSLYPELPKETGPK
jgi:thiosulfate/3-mercaptopyruvate sulfurtransferase